MLQRIHSGCLCSSSISGCPSHKQKIRVRVRQARSQESVEERTLCCPASLLKSLEFAYLSSLWFISSIASTVRIQIASRQQDVVEELFLAPRLWAHSRLPVSAIVSASASLTRLRNSGRRLAGRLPRTSGLFRKHVDARFPAVMDGMDLVEVLLA